MIQELVHTSVPSGLRPGSRGFCTVAMTGGMPVTLSEALEALSGYRFQFDPAGVQVSLNRPAFSSLQLTIGGRRYYIVSRVAPCEADYTNRPNRIAHHLVLTESDLADDGPTAILLREDNFLSTWNAAPSILEPRRSLHAEEIGAAPCTAWQNIAGDAGWAGELIRLSKAASGACVYVLYPSGCNVLDLVNEALALVPASERWRYTFHTAFPDEGELADANCVWRFMAATTKARVRTVSAFKASVIDLTQRLKAPPPSEEADAAREGRSLIPLAKSGDAAGPVQISNRRAKQADADNQPEKPERHQEPEVIGVDMGDDTSEPQRGHSSYADHAVRTSSPSGWAAREPISGVDATRGARGRRDRAPVPESPTPPWLIPVIALAIGVLLGAGMFWLARSPARPPVVPQDQPQATTGSKQPKEPVAAKNDQSTNQTDDSRQGTATPDRTQGQDSTQAANASQQPATAPNPQQPATISAQEPVKDPPAPPVPESPSVPVETTFKWKVMSQEDCRGYTKSENIARSTIEGNASLTGMGQPRELRVCLIASPTKVTRIEADGSTLRFHLRNINTGGYTTVGELTVSAGSDGTWFFSVKQDEQTKEDALEDVSLVLQWQTGSDKKQPGGPLILDLYPNREVNLIRTGAVTAEGERTWIGDLSDSQYHRLRSAKSLTDWTRRGSDLEFQREFSFDSAEPRPDTLILAIEQNQTRKLVLRLRPAPDRVLPPKEDVQTYIGALEATHKALEDFANQSRENVQISKDNLKSHLGTLKNMIELLKKDDHLRKLESSLNDQLSGPGIEVSDELGVIVRLGRKK